MTSSLTIIDVATTEQETVDFESFIADFYDNLLAVQESLGKEFEKVLYDNLWDLYERS